MEHQPQNGARELGAFPGDQEYRDLFRYIAWLVATSLPVTALVVAIGALSGSLTIIAVTVDYGLSLALNVMALVTLGVILRRNSDRHPYGTGKLENFAGFLYGVCIIPLALTVLAAAVRRFVNPPQAVDFRLAQLFFLAVVRLAVFAFWITRLGRKYPEHSPLLRAYYVDYRASFANEAAIFIGLLAGLMVANRGGLRPAVLLDIGIAVMIVFYLLYNGCRFIVRNARSLMDLPLEEKFQLKILDCLAKEYDSYEGVGTFYTRMSGTERLAQIELQFDGRRTMAEIERLRGRIEKRLRETGEKVVFHLIARCAKDPGNAGDLQSYRTETQRTQGV